MKIEHKGALLDYIVLYVQWGEKMKKLKRNHVFAVISLLGIIICSWQLFTIHNKQQAYPYPYLYRNLTQDKPCDAVLQSLEGETVKKGMEMARANGLTKQKQFVSYEVIKQYDNKKYAVEYNLAEADFHTDKHHKGQTLEINVYDADSSKSFETRKKITIIYDDTYGVVKVDYFNDADVRLYEQFTTELRQNVEICRSI